MKSFVTRFVRDDAGQDLIEYGLLVGVITTVTVGAIKTIGPIVEGYFTGLVTALNTTAP